MIGLARLAVCCTFLAVCSPLALADSVTVTGNVSFTPSSLTFAPPFATQTDTGIFAGFSNGQVNYLLGTVPYMDGFPQTVEAFTITNTTTGNVLAFYAETNTATPSYDNSGNLDVLLDEAGYFTINDGSALAGTFDLELVGNSPTGSSSNVAFLGTGELTHPLSVAVAPEPGSFLLLGTGFLMLAGLLQLRKRAVATATR